MNEYKIIILREASLQRIKVLDMSVGQSFTI